LVSWAIVVAAPYAAYFGNPLPLTVRRLLPASLYDLERAYSELIPLLWAIAGFFSFPIAIAATAALISTTLVSRRRSLDANINGDEAQVTSA
jgi:hypothetical protein